MKLIRTSIELPADVRKKAGELAQASDLNFQQWARRILYQAVREDRIISGVPAPALETDNKAA